MSSIYYDLILENAYWAGRTGAGYVYADGYMYMSGGLIANNPNVRLKDVWRSKDGIEWEQMTDSAGWDDRDNHAMAYHDNKLWVIGGFGSGAYLYQQNDVWSSSDNGATWTREVENASWSKRCWFDIVKFNDEYYIICGAFVTGPPTHFESRDDIWKSSDLVNWSLVVDPAPFTKRYDYRAIVFDGKMWVIGGADYTSGVLNDVWYTSDGTNWTQATSDAAFEARRGFLLFEYNNTLYVCSGSGNADWQAGNIQASLTDVWSSTDGINWTEQEIENIRPTAQTFALKTETNSIYVPGGRYGSPTELYGNNVYRIYIDRSGAITRSLRMVGARLESTAYFGEHLNSNDFDIPAYDVEYDPEFEKRLESIAYGDYSNRNIIGKQKISITFNVDLYEADSIDGEPAYSKLLAACACRTNTYSGTGISWMPDSDYSAKPITIWVVEQVEGTHNYQLLIKATGCMGNLIIQCQEIGEPIRMTFEMQGVLSDIVDATTNIESSITDSNDPAGLMGSTYKLYDENAIQESSTAVFENFYLNLNNAVNVYTDPSRNQGVEGARITGSNPELRIVDRMKLLSDYDFHGAHTANRDQRFSITIGDNIELSCTAVHLVQSYVPIDLDGLVGNQLVYRMGTDNNIKILQGAES